ncbi:AbrB/MazE/SpoVT family DNA-binding domain-containing protein [Candidatus Woesearchaeota archaeon]|nr:AbrB/MazE/SpoVT family DNA-binding domain-containing protein [Candidatus Woesearchaeota archaeon]
MVKVFLSKNGQVRVTIPKALADALQLQHKEEVDFIIKDNELVIKRKKNE